MEMASGETLLTLKDIAECISFDKSEHGITRTARQVRHWTQSDLLRPMTRKNTGTGIPRVYEIEPTLHIAALLLELSRYGATVDILKPVADALYDDFEEAGGNILLGETDEANVFLQVAWKEDPKTGKFVDARINIFSDFEMLGDEAGDIDKAPSSSIVVNLNTVFSRIFPWPKH
jgi:hypothetical protein